MKHFQKFFTIAAIGLACQFSVNAQTTASTGTEDPAATAVNETRNPAFPGGKSELATFVRKNLVYPVAARESKVQGTVEVTFTVNPDGTISNAKVTKGIGSGCDEQALKMIAKMPHWDAAKKNGEVIATTITLPVVFKLN
jgi:protein TonB